MNDQITLVTSPDDVYHDAIRVLLVDLNTEQTQTVSSALVSYETVPPIVVYVWKSSDNISWLLDKKLKSQVIVFNAESDKLELVGYFASMPASYYFGKLRDLSIINKRNIYGVEDFKELITNQIEHYETR